VVLARKLKIVSDKRAVEFPEFRLVSQKASFAHSILCVFAGVGWVSSLVRSGDLALALFSLRPAWCCEENKISTL
jgi:hypothetical protein